MSLAEEQFAETVEQFCEWAERQEHSLIDGRQFLISLISSIPHLLKHRYSGSSDEEFPMRGHEGWQKDYKRFADLPFQYYQVVFDPLDLNSTDEPVMGDLYDDFADIYGDLWHGLQARLAGDQKEAISLWIDSYFIHWGQHAVCALGAVDAYYRQDPNLSEQAGGHQSPKRSESE